MSYDLIFWKELGPMSAPRSTYEQLNKCLPADLPQMPGGWFGSAPLQSELADVDGCKTDRCHADPLGSSCPLQASPTAGISAPPHHDRGPRRDREK